MNALHALYRLQEKGVPHAVVIMNALHALYRLQEKGVPHAVVIINALHVLYRLQEKGVGKDAEWVSLLEKAPLRGASDTDSASLSHAIDIFVERHHLLWKVSLNPSAVASLPARAVKEGGL